MIIVTSQSTRSAAMSPSRHRHHQQLQQQQTPPQQAHRHTAKQCTTRYRLIRLSLYSLYVNEQPSLRVAAVVAVLVISAAALLS